MAREWCVECGWRWKAWEVYLAVEWHVGGMWMYVGGVGVAVGGMWMACGWCVDGVQGQACVVATCCLLKHALEAGLSLAQDS